jgi:hypothetical protein
MPRLYALLCMAALPLSRRASQCLARRQRIAGQIRIVGIEIRRANFRCEVTSLALSIARWVHSSTMAAFPEAPL